MKEKHLLDLLQLINVEFANLGYSPQLIYPRLQINDYLSIEEIGIIEKLDNSTQQTGEICRLLESKPKEVFIELQKIFKKNNSPTLLKIIQDCLNANEETRDLLWLTNDISLAVISGSSMETNDKCKIKHLQYELCALYEEELNLFKNSWMNACLRVELEMKSFFNPHIQIDNPNSKANRPDDYKYFLKSGYKSIVLIGEHGCGKSMLTNEIAKQWKVHLGKMQHGKSENEDFVVKMFDFVILIRLDEVNGKTLGDLINMWFPSKQAKNVELFESLLEKFTIQERVLFIFDGYDEYISKNSEIEKLLGKRLWPKSTTVVTMRRQGFGKGDQFGKKKVYNLIGFTDNGIKYQLKKFKLPDRTLSKKQKEIFKVPLYLMVICCIEREQKDPNSVVQENYEIFDLFREYTNMLFQRYSKFNDTERKKFLHLFGEVIYESKSPLEKITRILEIAVKVGILISSSTVAKIANSEYGTPEEFRFPHTLFRIYFHAEYLALLLEDDENKNLTFMPNNSRTYLSYFLSGLSDAYKNHVYENSWNRKCEVYRLPYIAHAENLYKLKLDCMRETIIFHSMPRPDDDEISLPDVTIDKLVPNVNTAFIHGAYLTEEIYFDNYIKVGLSGCTLDRSFCATLTESKKIEQIAFSRCSFILSDMESIEITKPNRLKSLIFRGGSNTAEILELLGPLPCLTRLFLESIAQPIKINIAMYYQNLERICIDYEVISNTNTFLTLSSLSRLTHLQIFNGNAAFPRCILLDLIKTKGFSELKEFHLINDSGRLLNAVTQTVIIDQVSWNFAKLTTVNFVNCDINEIFVLFDFAECFPNIETLAIKSSASDVDETLQQQLRHKLNKLRYFHHLKKLRLFNMGLAGECFTDLSKSIKSMPDLQALDVSCNNFHSYDDATECFTNLASCNSLRNLCLNGCKFDQFSFNALVDSLTSAKSNLECLKLQIETNLLNTDKFICILPNLTELKIFAALNIYNENVADNQPSLILPQNLEVLDFSQLNMTFAPNTLFDCFKYFHNLHSLTINGKFLSKGHIDSFQSIVLNDDLTHLKSLKLIASNDNTIDLFRVLGKLVGLESLFIAETKLHTNELKALVCSLKVMGKLTTLDMEGLQILVDEETANLLWETLGGMTSLANLRLPWDFNNVNIHGHYLAARYRILKFNFHQLPSFFVAE